MLRWHNVFKSSSGTSCLKICEGERLNLVEICPGFGLASLGIPITIRLCQNTECKLLIRDSKAADRQYIPNPVMTTVTFYFPSRKRYSSVRHYTNKGMTRVKKMKISSALNQSFQEHKRARKSYIGRCLYGLLFTNSSS